MNKGIVGLELAYKTTNYGAQLQAFATQQAVKRMGYATKIINLGAKALWTSHNFGRGIIQYFFLNNRDRKARMRTRVHISNPTYLNNREARKQSSSLFIQNHLSDITVYPSYQALARDVKSMKAVLIGSDQKWLPGFCYRKISSLNYAPEGVRRISYATSLGVSEYPQYCRAMSKKMWEKMDYLSVREEQGAKIIREICGDINVEVVVDPTYLYTKKEWEDMIPTKKMSGAPYVFCYFLGNDDDSKRCARRYAEKHHLKLVSVLSDESYSPYDQEYADELVQGASPEDFVNWIRGAAVVFTDSFHGTAFSVINERQFYVFYRRRMDSKMSRNSRIDNVLSLWKLGARLITDNNINWDSFDEEEIDYREVGSIVDSERRRSLDFLTKALSD